MSVPSLANPLSMPAKVSRLPKLGLRPNSTQAADLTANARASSSPTARLTNGFHHHPGPARVNSVSTAPETSVKQNRIIRGSASFSLKWRKENEAAEYADGEGEQKWRQGKCGTGHSCKHIQNDSKCQLGSPARSQHEAKKTAATSEGKRHGFGLPVMSQSLKSSPRPLSVSRGGTKLGQTASVMMKATKVTMNRTHGSRPRNGRGRSLRLSQNLTCTGSLRPGSKPGSKSGSPIQKEVAVTRSHSSLGSVSPVMLTERNRLHCQSLTQVQRLPLPTLNSSSIHTATGVTATLAEGRVKSHSSPWRSGYSIPSILSPTALKKPLLSSLVSTPKPSVVSYKLSRPSLHKQPTLPRVTSGNKATAKQERNGELAARRSSREMPSKTKRCPEISPEASEREWLLAEPASHREVSIVGEMLEDMSLSSTSSLDWNSTRQENMDDFENTGEPTLIPQQSTSSLQDYHEQSGSSLDLSPSDSCGSGGTYMWDEEGLVPMENTVIISSINTNSNVTHHIGSVESDLNSMDILNNLDSCDLDEDDLMLDADLPEDASLQSDGDGVAHMAQWRMRQLCWGSQDVHINNKRSPHLSHDTPGFGLDVEGLAEDCSAVRSKLEYLRLLLQDMNEDTLTIDTQSPDTNDLSNSSDTQVQTLLKEVQQLREELRSRDLTISQLCLKLTVAEMATRCCCQQTKQWMDQHTQTTVAGKESVASQTPLIEQKAFPPVPFLSPPWQYQRSMPYRVVPRPSIPSHRARKITDISCHQSGRPETTDAPEPSPCFAQPQVPADSILHHVNTNTGEHITEQRRPEEDGDAKDRRRAFTRSLKLPLQSKLHPPLSQVSRPTAVSISPSAMMPPLKLSRPKDPKNNSNSGIKVKTGSFSLPKPKSLTPHS